MSEQVEAIEWIKERWKDIAPEVQCEEWWWSAVRHCDRNMEYLCPHTGADYSSPDRGTADVHPDRYDGPPYAHAAHDIATLLSLLADHDDMELALSAAQRNHCGCLGGSLDEWATP